MTERTEINRLLAIVLRKKGNALFLTPPLYEDAKSYLLQDRLYRVVIRSTKDISRVSARRAEMSDNFGYMKLDYEFGFLLEKKLQHQHFSNLSETGVYYEFSPKNSFIFPSRMIKPYNRSERRGYSVGKIRLRDSFDEYSAKIERIKDYIGNGDTYQINLTTESYFVLKGNLASFVSDLLQKQSARYIAIINNGNSITLSISPELFFKIEGNRITTAPMKGTISRGINSLEDNAQMDKLRTSIKEQAENLMIVDLLRNDLGKICEFGSVEVEKLFEVEVYETVHQMVSHISGRLREGTSFDDIIRSLFPCGSVTGAPKFRSMEIISEIEKRVRGLYTGSIFFFSPMGITANVAIRTIEIDSPTTNGQIYHAKLALGSGIVWDSTPKSEFNEIIKKAEFLTQPFKEFYLFETMLSVGQTIPYLESHLARIKKAAAFFLFPFDETEIRTAIAKTPRPPQNCIVRLILTKWGEIRTEVKEIVSLSKKLKVLLSSIAIDTQNSHLYFKTSNRGHYSEEYKKAKLQGFDEVLFLNEHSLFTEGSWTNFFFEIDGNLFTPPVSDGLLGGILRENLLIQGKVSEKSLGRKELEFCDKVFFGNSVRGLMAVESIVLEKTAIFSNKT